MKYSYAYKTSDGQRHEASMEAKSREEVFAALRAQGIKAIKVVAADGSRANGEVRGVRKRAVAIVAIAVAIVAGVVAYKGGTRSVASVGGNGGLIEAALPTAPRHQIYGDPAIVEAFERGHFDPYLTNRLDQLLAWFAQPGKLMCPKDTDLRRSAFEFVQAVCSESGGGCSNATSGEGTFCRPDAQRTGRRQNDPSQFAVRVSALAVKTADPREVRELKQIVNGLREELAAYLANGNGTPRSYWRRLIQRIQQEAQIYERTRRELERETDPAAFEQKNQALRNLGLRTIPNPKDNE